MKGNYNCRKYTYILAGSVILLIPRREPVNCSWLSDVINSFDDCLLKHSRVFQALISPNWTWKDVSFICLITSNSFWSLNLFWHGRKSLNWLDCPHFPLETGKAWWNEYYMCMLIKIMILFQSLMVQNLLIVDFPLFFFFFDIGFLKSPVSLDGRQRTYWFTFPHLHYVQDMTQGQFLSEVQLVLIQFSYSYAFFIIRLWIYWCTNLFWTNLLWTWRCAQLLSS